MNPMLRMYLLGVPEVLYDEHPLPIPRLQTRALCYRLALNLQPVARDELCFLFWPDVDNATARRNLSQLLSHLRRALPASHLLITTKEHVRLDPAGVWSDTTSCEVLYTEGDALSGHPRRMVDLYRGPFLDGFSLPGTPEYENWQLAVRQRYEQHTLEALMALYQEAMQRGNHLEAVAYARRHLAMNELDEEVHRQIIELYAAIGDRSAALQQYERCVAVLKRELGVDPLPETSAAYAAALANRPRVEEQERMQQVWTTFPGPDIPLIGRTEALQALAQQFRCAQAGQGQIVLVMGEAGIGKSRLLQTFAEGLREQATVLAAACYTNTQAVPYQPVVEALRPMLERAVAAGGKTVSSWLSEATLLFPELRTLHPHLPPPLEARTETARGRLFEALRRLLWSLMRSVPVLLCLDDLHWSDRSTLDWLGYLGRYLRGNRLLIIGTLRSEDGETVGELRRQLARLGCVTYVELHPLRHAEIEQFIAHMAGETFTNTVLSARLMQVTGGNPFFLQETMEALLEAGDTAPLDAVPAVPLSTTVRETIQRRVERLSPKARQILEAGAVLGPVFHFEAVWHTAGRQELEAQDALDELVARRLLIEEMHQIRFRHELIQAAVYRDLSHGRRRLLHRRAAETLRWRQRATDAVLSATQASQIGHHYAEAGEGSLAASCFLEAGDQARKVHAAQEAIGFYGQALDVLADLPDTPEHTQQQIQCQIGLGAAHMVTDGWASPLSQQAFQRALALAHQSSSPATFPALWGLHEIFMFRGEYEQAQVAGIGCYRLAHQTRDPDLLLQAHHALWGVHFHAPLSQDGVARALYHAREGIRLYRADQHHGQTLQYGGHDPGICCRFTAAQSLWLLGFPDQARQCIQENVALGHSLLHPFSKAHALMSAATVHLYCRQAEQVQTTAQAVIAIAVEHSIAMLQAEGKIHLGWALAQQGKINAGLELLQEGIAEWRAMDIRLQQPYHLALLVDVYLSANQITTGLTVLDEAMAMVTAIGERYYEPELHRLRGELLMAQGRAEAEADLAYRRAITTARTQGLTSLALRASIGQSRLWLAQGNRRQAHQRLARIYAEFGEGFDTPDLQEAQTLLAATRG